jgi:hypothetical protein
VSLPLQSVFLASTLEGRGKCITTVLQPLARTKQLFNEKSRNYIKLRFVTFGPLAVELFTVVI